MAAKRAKPGPNGSGSTSPGHARARAEAIHVVRLTDARVRAIMEEMAGLTWYPGRVRELAAEWGVSTTTVGTAATEASRMLQASVDPEAVQAALLQRLEYLGQAALDRTEEVVDGKGQVHRVHRPDTRSAVRCAEVLLEAWGAARSRKERHLAGLNRRELLERLLQQAIRDPAGREAILRVARQAESVEATGQVVHDLEETD